MGIPDTPITTTNNRANNQPPQHTFPTLIFCSPSGPATALQAPANVAVAAGVLVHVAAAMV